MELSDDLVLAAIQQDVGDRPFWAGDLLRGTPRRLIFPATVNTSEPDEALRMLQDSIDRLEARGFVEDRGDVGRAISEAGREHILQVR